MVESEYQRYRKIARNWAVGYILALLSIPLFTLGFLEARKAYWDHKVKQMCEKDGGVTVFERILLSRKEYEALGGGKHGMHLPSKRNSSKNFPYFFEYSSHVIRFYNPKVLRNEYLVKTQHDNRILAKSVSYSRIGGDFPTGLFHDSSFRCPETRKPLTTIMFQIDE